METNNRETFLEILKTVNRDGIDKLIAYLEKSTFFTDPASANFHSNYEGGLCQHSLNVYYRLRELTGKDDDTIKIVGLLHDICKIGTYEVYQKNVKDTVSGVWTSCPAYRYKKSKLPYGHGEKSVFMLQNFIKLTMEESLAIRWHMGAYEPKELYSELGDAQSSYPLVILVNTADLLATKIDEKEE